MLLVKLLIRIEITGGSGLEVPEWEVGRHHKLKKYTVFHMFHFLTFLIAVVVSLRLTL